MNKTDQVHHLLGRRDLIHDKIIAKAEAAKLLPAIEHPSTVRELSEGCEDDSVSHEGPQQENGVYLSLPPRLSDQARQLAHHSP
jgi:hypothetical protein